LRRIISEALLTKVRDPRIGLVTVTGVKVSREFDTAKVYVTIYGDERTRDESMAGLRSAAPFLQSEISREIRLRRVPRLRFVYDDSVERGFRIDAALRELKSREGGGKEDEPPTPTNESDENANR
jgi:ribosome-binding factor A